MDDSSELFYLSNDSSDQFLLLNDSCQIDIKENADFVELLTKWGLQSLYEKCIEERIGIDTLKNMTSRHAEMLMKDFKLGVLVNFEKKLKTWQLAESNSENINPNVLNISNTSQIICTERVKNKFDQVNLEELLMTTSQGRAIIDRRNRNIEMNDGCRMIILDILINTLIQKDIKMTVSLAEELAKQVITVFPNEIMSVYFSREAGKAPKGKIYSKYFNQLRPLKNSGLVQQKKQIKNETAVTFVRCIDASTIVSEEDIEENLEAIQADNCCWAEIEQHYASTSKYRLLQISKALTTDEILEQWKHYKNPQGFKLIDFDFKMLYPEACDLTSRITEYVDKMFNIFNIKIKDQASISLLNDIKAMQNLSENGRYLSIFYLLHAVLVPTSKVVKLVNEKKIHVKYSIKDSQNSFIITGNTTQEAEAILKKKINKKKSIQPLIIITGSVVEPKSILIYFDGVKYKLYSVLHAVDICFKIMHIFSLEYPLESTLVWNFIQKLFYFLKTKYDKCHPSVNLLCSELEHQI